MSDDPVGRGNPPKHSQFKPGVSGNPRGRRRKLPRADIPSQIGKDFRRIAETKVFTTQNGRRVKISLIEGVFMSIFKQAAEGKISQQRLVLKYFGAALAENLERFPTCPTLMCSKPCTSRMTCRSTRCSSTWWTISPAGPSGSSEEISGSVVSPLPEFTFPKAYRVRPNEHPWNSGF